MLKLGVHVSIAEGIPNAVERAKRLGCTSMQIFSRNPRQLRKGGLVIEQAREFKEGAAQAGISPVVVHIPYLLNLASNRPSVYKMSIREFIADLKDVGTLGADYLVFHPGSYKGSTEKSGITRVVNALKKILKETKGASTMVLIENTSGSGSWLGACFSHHRFILESLEFSPRVGICLDTAHAWGAGYPINSKEGVDSLLNEIDKQIGLSRLKVVHLNDTKDELGSHKDRHYAIGRGRIGKKGFSALINHPGLKETAFILETPKETERDDMVNLKTVRNLYRPS